MLLKDFSTLKEAREYKKVVGRLMSPDMLLKHITMFGLVDSLIDNPTTNEASAVRAALNFGSEFNFIIGHTSVITPMLDILIEAGIVSEGFKASVVQYANVATLPYAKTTLQDFNKEKGNIVRKKVSVEKQFCKIVITADCESHNPQIYKRTSFDDGSFEYVRVSGFTGVSKRGVYRIPCPDFGDMWVDDAYGVVG